MKPQHHSGIQVQRFDRMWRIERIGRICSSSDELSSTATSDCFVVARGECSAPGAIGLIRFIRRIRSNL
jgi:hypothetical protein